MAYNKKKIKKRAEKHVKFRLAVAEKMANHEQIKREKRHLEDMKE